MQERDQREARNDSSRGLSVPGEAVADERERIDAGALDAHAPVEVRRGDTAGCTDQTEELAVRHCLTGSDVDAREVRVQ